MSDIEGDVLGEPRERRSGAPKAERTAPAWNEPMVVREAGRPAGVLDATEKALRDRLDEANDELAHKIEERESLQEHIAQLRAEQRRLQIALRGFDRARNPRRRNPSPKES